MPNVTSIGDFAFTSCTFKSIDMPNVTSIGSCAFDYCKALAEVSMPNVTSIGSYAFRDAAITSVDLSSVTFIGEAAFSIFDGTTRTTCPNPNLVSVKFGETVPNGLKYARFSSSTKLLIPAEAYEAYQQYEEAGYTFYDYDGNPLKSAIPEGYEQIGDSDAYYKIDGDTLYVDGLVENTNIPDAAFSSYDGGIVIPENVTKVEIGENITALDSYAFDWSAFLMIIDNQACINYDILVSIYKICAILNFVEFCGTL